MFHNRKETQWLKTTALLESGFGAVLSRLGSPLPIAVSLGTVHMASLTTLMLSLTWDASVVHMALSLWGFSIPVASLYSWTAWTSLQGSWVLREKAEAPDLLKAWSPRKLLPSYAFGQVSHYAGTESVWKGTAHGMNSGRRGTCRTIF